jgi:hypothetical protein
VLQGLVHVHLLQRVWQAPVVHVLRPVLLLCWGALLVRPRDLSQHLFQLLVNRCLIFTPDA